jgi:hypothetical protein
VQLNAENVAVIQARTSPSSRPYRTSRPG